MYPTPPPSPPLNELPSPEFWPGGALANWLRLTGRIGVGVYGIVYTAIDMNTNIPYAVKALNKIWLDSEQQAFQQQEISSKCGVYDQVFLSSLKIITLSLGNNLL